MRFTAKNIGRKFPTRSIRAFVPEEPPHDPGNVAVLEGQIRPLDANVLRVIDAFTREADQRRARGHDCGVFALECMLGKSFRDTVFWRPGGKKVRAESDPTEIPKDTAGAPITKPGDVLLLGRKLDYHEELRFLNPHLLVHATTDQETPLYASKFGVEGPVALSSLEDALHFYTGSILLGRVDSLSAVSYAM